MQLRSLLKRPSSVALDNRTGRSVWSVQRYQPVIAVKYPDLSNMVEDIVCVCSALNIGTSR